MSYQISIKRTVKEAPQTRGEFTLSVDGVQVLTGKTLELPWIDNQHGISCIPTGTYNLEHWNSEKYPNCLHVKDVPNRDAILIHNGNYDHNTHGCILLGKSFTDLDKDGYLDITESKATIQKIMELISGDGVLIISD